MMKSHFRLVAFLPLLVFVFSCNVTPKSTQETPPSPREVWSREQANDWYTQWGWLRGANFNPSSAINQLEMWQAESFDTAAINRELGWAEGIGMNAMRVYLHHLAWEVDPEGFKSRMSQYLEIADTHGIATIFVFFDDCWNPTYVSGKQPEPKPGIHNSGWVQDPGTLIFEKPELDSILETYMKDVLTHFAKDTRIVLWDVYNEPGNSGYGNRSMPLLQKAFQWGREVNPSQPLSAGIWHFDLKELNKFQLENSDVITYHNYQDSASHARMIDTLKTYGKPLICTEYMARTRNSIFQTIMPMLKAHNIVAINWGLVAGKSNTIYAWDTPIPDGGEPSVWFHDIFRTDGSVYSQPEVDLIRKLSEVSNP